MARTTLALLIALVAACGGGSVSVERPPSSEGTATTAPSLPSTTVPPDTATPTTATPTTAATPLPPEPLPAITPAAPAPLTSMRFVMTVEVLPHDGGPALTVGTIEGWRSSDPTRTRLIGEILDDRFELVSDGDGWWDLDDPGYELADADVSLLYMGFLQPGDIAPLLAVEDRWEIVADETHLGVPVTHLQRRNVVKDVDWPLGDLTTIDVWRDATGEVLRLVAQFATGDNEGFPVSTWELMERNPEVVITLPTG